MRIRPGAAKTPIICQVYGPRSAQSAEAAVADMRLSRQLAVHGREYGRMIKEALLQTGQSVKYKPLEVLSMDHGDHVQAPFTPHHVFDRLRYHGGKGIVIQYELNGLTAEKLEAMVHFRDTYGAHTVLISREDRKAVEKRLSVRILDYVGEYWQIADSKHGASHLRQKLGDLIAKARPGPSFTRSMIEIAAIVGEDRLFKSAEAELVAAASGALRAGRIADMARA